MSAFFKIPDVDRFIARAAERSAVPAVLTSYAIIVQERADNRRAIFLKVTRTTASSIDTRQQFAIVKELDPRLEEFLTKMARMENARRRRAKAALNPDQTTLPL